MADAEMITPDGWRKIGDTVRAIVDGHFARGVGPTGKPLAPYSADYAAERKEEGDTVRPDMQRTGTFRRSIAVATRANGVSVGARGGNPDQVEGWAKANAKRPVVALGKREVDKVMDVVLAEIDKALEGIVNG